MGPDVKPLTEAVQALGTKLDAILTALNQILELLQKKTQPSPGP